MLEELIHLTESLEVCGSCGSGEAALDQLSGARPDVVLIDVSLPGMSGFELLERIRAAYPELACVMLSGHRSARYAAQAKAGGAKAYVVKTDVQRLTGVLRDVRKNGGAFLALGLGAD